MAAGAGGMAAGAGVADAALLAPLTEDSFVHNLQVRFARDLIYTYVGGGVVCVNPGRALPLYSAELARAYGTRPPHRLPPHVYGVAAAAHARARDRRQPQCVVVTGESGAGKTEAARLCLQCALLAAPAPPPLAAPLAAQGTLLEAFGNAATQRNHNASRFGKLLELEVDFKGELVSGRITHYLLETERAHSPPRGERNFHVLYQLLAGADVPLLKRLKLQRSWQHYRILGGAEAGSAAPGGARAADRDTEHFAFTTAAMRALGLSAPDVAAVLRALAFMLKLGNVRFEPHHTLDGSIGARLEPLHELREACALVGVDAEALAAALTAPRAPAAGDVPASPPGDADSEAGAECAGDAEWARAALDRLLGALYSRLFTWLVARAEAALRPAGGARAPAPATAPLALLDLYGFEVLADNGLERLLINYAAERLQAAVAAGARRDQEEYAREGLGWHALPARDPGAADLLDAGPECVLGALRAAAARAEPARDLLARLQRVRHARLRLHPPDRFTVVHFAGAVTYDAREMASKNRDAVCGACGGALGGARDALLAELFAAERGAGASPRRPLARSCRQRALVLALVRRLPASPRLVRCVRADAALRPHRFDAALLRHQIRTQGILEMAVLARAGWCEAVCARELVARYGLLARAPPASPASGEPVRRARVLLRALPIPAAEFAYGRTKVFIRSPRTRGAAALPGGSVGAAAGAAHVAGVRRVAAAARTAAAGARGRAAAARAPRLALPRVPRRIRPDGAEPHAREGDVLGAVPRTQGLVRRVGGAPVRGRLRAAARVGRVAARCGRGRRPVCGVRGRGRQGGARVGPRDARAVRAVHGGAATAGGALAARAAPRARAPGACAEPVALRGRRAGGARGARAARAARAARRAPPRRPRRHGRARLPLRRRGDAAAARRPGAAHRARVGARYQVVPRGPERGGRAARRARGHAVRGKFRHVGGDGGVPRGGRHRGRGRAPRAPRRPHGRAAVSARRPHGRPAESVRQPHGRAVVAPLAGHPLILLVFKLISSALSHRSLQRLKLSSVIHSKCIFLRVLSMFISFRQCLLAFTTVVNLYLPYIIQLKFSIIGKSVNEVAECNK